MKVIIANIRYFVSGGPETYMFNVKKLLESKGHEVIPFSVKSAKNVQSEYENYFAEPMGGQDVAYFDNLKKTPKSIIDTLTRLFYSLHVKKRLEKIIKDTKPDVVYVLNHYNKLSPSIIDACTNMKIPVIARLSDYFLLCPQAHFLSNGKLCRDCITKGLFSCVKKRCVRNSLTASLLKFIALKFQRDVLKLYEKVDFFVCTNQFMIESMKESGFSKDKLKLINTFVPNIEDNDSGSANKKTEKYILYFGRLAYEKGVDVLIKTYLSSDFHKNNIKLKIVGGLFEKLDYVQWSNQEQEQIKKVIEFSDFLRKDELREKICQSMFCVFPARWYENCPHTILEAYSLGKAVISTNHGSIPYFVKDGETGLVFENENIDDLRKKILQMVNHFESGDIKSFENNAKKFIARFNKEEHYAQLFELFKKVKRV